VKTFLRHLAATTLTVAVIVALGLAWAHASGASVPDGYHPGVIRPAGVTAAPPPRALPGKAAGGRGIAAGNPRLTGGFSLEHLQNVVRTTLVETVIIGIVVTASATRLRRRRARRHRRLSTTHP
jgi:hypothetical protein